MLFCFAATFRPKFQGAARPRKSPSPMNAARIRRLRLTKLPQLPCGAARRRHRLGGADRTERRRQDQSDRSDIAVGAGTRIAARDARRSRILGRRRVLGSVGRHRGNARPRSLGTGIDAPDAEVTPTTRKCRVDREPVPSAAAFADHLRVVWLVPAMDRLFKRAASERRRFLDRLVLAVDAEQCKPGVRARARAAPRATVCSRTPPDPHWLDAIEHETAELAVAVAAMRAETVGRLQGTLAAATIRRRCSRRPISRCRAGWNNCCPTIPAARSKTATGRCSRTTAPATPPPAARSTAPTSPTSRSSTPPRTCRRPTLRPRAEGAADRARAAHAGLLRRMSGYAPVLLLDGSWPTSDPARRIAHLWRARTAGPRRCG